MSGGGRPRCSRHDDDADGHGGPGVLEGKERRRDDLDPRNERQADARRRAGRTTRPAGRAAVEPAPLEERAHDRGVEGHEPGRGREADDGRELEREAQRPLQLADVAGRDLLGEGRQEGGGQGDGEQPQRQLLDAGGVIERRGAPLFESGGDHPAQGEVDLVDARPEDPGDHEPPDPPDRRVAEGRAEGEAHALLPQERDLEGELEDAADDDAGGEDERRLAGVPRPAGHGGDDGDVEQDGRRGRDEEAAEGVQHAARQGGQRDEEEIGEHDPGHEDRQAPLPGDVAEAVGDDLDQPGREDDPQDRRDGHDQREVPEEGVGEAPQPLSVRPALEPGEGRDEGRRHGPFARQAAEEVGDGEGDGEGVGAVPGPEVIGLQEVADVAQDAADERRRRRRRPWSGSAGFPVVMVHGKSALPARGRLTLRPELFYHRTLSRGEKYGPSQISDTAAPPQPPPEGRQHPDEVRPADPDARDARGHRGQGPRGRSSKLLPALFKAIDTSVKKGAIKKNTGSRYKSRLSRQVALLSPTPAK